LISEANEPGAAATATGAAAPAEEQSEFASRRHCYYQRHLDDHHDLCFMDIRIGAPPSKGGHQRDVVRQVIVFETRHATA
jgi:hypothetical protein